MSEQNGRDIKLPTFASGQALSAADFNALSDALKKILGGSGQNGQKDVNPVAPLVMQMIIVANVNQEYLTCRTWDGTNIGSTDIFVAKPPLLTASNYIGGVDILGNSYSFTGIDAVTVTSPDAMKTENWLVTQNYNHKDVIQACCNIRNGIDSTLFLDWRDMNIDGRCWAVAAS